MSFVAEELSTNSKKNKPKSVSRLHGMMSAFLSGLKDLTTDSIPDPPRPLPLDNTNTPYNLRSKVSQVSTSTPEFDKCSQESDSATSTPTMPRQKTKRKTNGKQEKKTRTESGFHTPPHYIGANRNFISINHSNNVQIGPSFEQKYFIASAPTTSTTNIKIKKTPRIKALLEDNTPIIEYHLDIASTHVGYKWREIGRILTFTDGQLDQFHQQGGNHLKEVIYQMLLAWKQQYPKEATIGKLSSSLWEVGEREAVQKLAENVDNNETD